MLALVHAERLRKEAEEALKRKYEERKGQFGRLQAMIEGISIANLLEEQRKEADRLAAEEAKNAEEEAKKAEAAARQAALEAAMAEAEEVGGVESGGGRRRWKPQVGGVSVRGEGGGGSPGGGGGGKSFRSSGAEEQRGESLVWEES